MGSRDAAIGKALVVEDMGGKEARGITNNSQGSGFYICMAETGHPSPLNQEDGFKNSDLKRMVLSPPLQHY